MGPNRLLKVVMLGLLASILVFVGWMWVLFGAQESIEIYPGAPGQRVWVYEGDVLRVEGQASFESASYLEYTVIVIFADLSITGQPAEMPLGVSSETGEYYTYPAVAVRDTQIEIEDAGSVQLKFESESGATVTVLPGLNGVETRAGYFLSFLTALVLLLMVYILFGFKRRGGRNPSAGGN